MQFSTYYNPAQRLLSINYTLSGQEFLELGNGHIKLSKNGGTSGYISFLTIHSAMQRQGYGTKLLEKMEKEAKEKGLTDLSVLPTPESIPFWEKKGYKFMWYDVLSLGYRWKKL